jgi:hypothetical protein
MRAPLLAFVVVTTASFSACGGSSSSSNGNGDGGAQPGSDSGTTGGDASGADGGGPGDDSGTTSDAFNPMGPVQATTGIGPIPVAAGEEKTVCILKRLDTPVDIVATRIVADLAPGSHHLIVYKTNDANEVLTPYPCMPFQGLSASAVTPLVLAGKAHTDYPFPAGVGMAVGAHQMLRIEAHYINASNAAIMGSGTVQIEGLPASQAGSYQLADFGFWGTLQISIPPNGTFSTPVNFQRGISGTHVFAVSSHQHHLGTEVKVWKSASAGDTSNMILDEHDWSNPLLKSFTPPLDVASGTGFSYQCSWQNTTPNTVTFGESALNEMCFATFFYYPTHGFDRCIDGMCSVTQR